MKTFVRVIAILFTLVMAFFTVYQWAVGNPFHDEINPVPATFLFFIMGLVGLIASFRKDLQNL